MDTSIDTSIEDTATTDTGDRSHVNVILWLILILLIGIGLGIFLWLGLGLFQSSTPSTPAVSCAGLISSVPDVSDENQFTPCCNLEGDCNGRWYDNVNDWTVLSVTDIPAANQVCLEFCSDTTLPTTCNGQTASYTNCLNKLTPQNCTDPALPVAKNGSTPLYAVGRGQDSCYPCPSTCP